MESEKQQEAVVKMRAGLVKKYTCLRCSYYDQSHGKDKYATRLRDGWCTRCWDEYDRMERRIEQCAWAQKYIQEPFVVLDSETTGLDWKSDEVIELAMVDGHSGSTLFTSLIQPEHLEERWSLATHIHGITRDMLKGAPRFPDLWPAIATILRRYRRVLVYNASFDHSLLQSTALRYGYRLPDWHGRQWECLMEQYARYNGFWSNYHHGWGWCTLDEACRHFQVTYNGASHRALADAVRARGVLLGMVDQHGKIDLPEAPKPPVADFFCAGDDDLGEDHPF
jgi:DNA polymerase III epsilon subunit-like protein